MSRGVTRVAALTGLWVLAALARWIYWSWAEPTPIMEGLTHKYLVCAGHLLDGQVFMLQVSPGAEVPYRSLALTLMAVLLGGMLWTWIATAFALRGPLLSALRDE